MEESLLERLARIELTQEHHSDLLVRMVASSEKTALIGERLANQSEDNKRLWGRVEVLEANLSGMTNKVEQNCDFCSGMRKGLWWIATLATAGIAFFVKYWMEKHG